MSNIQLGLHIAKQLYGKANLVLVARSACDIPNDESVKQLQIDVAESDCPKKVVAAAVDAWGKVDGVVFNAGVIEPIKRIKDADISEWQHLFNVNFFSVVALVGYNVTYFSFKRHFPSCVNRAASPCLFHRVEPSTLTRRGWATARVKRRLICWLRD